MRIRTGVLLLAGAAVLLGLEEGGAATRLVPAQYPTIQQAVDAAVDRDTVLVSPGTYVENVRIERDIVVRSAAGPAVTVIDAGAPGIPGRGSAVWISDGSIEGFSLRNGSGSASNPNFPLGTNGGGVLVYAPARPGPVVRGNWIYQNHALEGGGIYVNVEFTGEASIIGNRIYDNTAVYDGAAVHFSTPIPAGFAPGSGRSQVGAGLLEGNEIFNHSTQRGTTVYTGEITVRNNVIACNASWEYAALTCAGEVEGNTVVGNWSDSARAAVAVSGFVDDRATVIRNCISDNRGGGLRCFDGGPYWPPPDVFVIECNDITGNSPGGQVIGDCGAVIGHDGNISEDPRYGRGSCPTTSGDWCLAEDSPLLPASSPPGCGLIGALGACPPDAVEDGGAPPAGKLAALPARPNPFAERTMIPFHLQEGREVEVAIVNVMGRRVRQLAAGWLASGNHSIIWDGRMGDGGRAAAGAYVAIIRAGGLEVTRTLLLLP